MSPSFDADLRKRRRIGRPPPRIALGGVGCRSSRSRLSAPASRMRSGVRQTSSASRGVEHRRLPGVRRDSTAELRLSVIRSSGDSTPIDLEVQMKLAHITKRKRRKMIGISLYHGIARNPSRRRAFCVRPPVTVTAPVMTGYLIGVRAGIALPLRKKYGNSASSDFIPNTYGRFS